jgi:hypothetical protein
VEGLIFHHECSSTIAAFKDAVGLIWFAEYNGAVQKLNSLAKNSEVCVISFFSILIELRSAAVVSASI